MSLYFAYGSNLDAEGWRAWCDSAGQDALSIEPMGPAWLPDHEPVFHYKSRLRNGGALDVRPRFGCAAPGALFRVRDFTALDKKEGAAGGYYERVNVVVLTDDGRAHEAVTYRVCKDRVVPHVAPSEAYFDMCARGLRDFGHDDAQLRAAAEGIAVPCVPDAVFVYGTLMRGEKSHNMMQGYADVCDAEFDGGYLIQIDWYPGLLLSSSLRGGTEGVRGEVYRYEQVSALLETLDSYEDFAGYGQDKSLYRRSLVRVRTEALDGVLAWTYVSCLHPSASPRRFGDWRQHQRTGGVTN